MPCKCPHWKQINYTQKIEMGIHEEEMNRLFGNILDNISKSNLESSNIMDLWKDTIERKSIIKNSILISKTPNIIQQFVDNFQDIMISAEKFKNNPGEIRQEDRILLENIEHISKLSLDSAEHVYNELFTHFSWKNLKIEDFKNRINSMWNIAFLNKSIYSINTESNSEQFLIFRDIYLFCVNYIFSKYKWFSEINRMHSSSDINNLIDWSKNKSREKYIASEKFEDQKYIEYILFMFNEIVWKNNFNELWKNFSWFRQKEIESAVIKILKDPEKRIEEIKKWWILWDQIWFAFNFENIGELKKIAESLKKELEKSWWKIKFNDRWVLSKNHGNKDTVKWIDPFVNIWLTYDWINIAEISLRQSEEISLKEISNTYKENEDMSLLFRSLISRINSINHEVYKFSQNIKILRTFLVEHETLKWVINKSASVKKYIKEKKDLIVSEISKNIEGTDIEVDFKNFNTKLILENVVLSILEEKTWSVITGIARDYIEKHIIYNSDIEEFDVRSEKEKYKHMWLNFINTIADEKNQKEDNKKIELKIPEVWVLKSKPSIESYYKRVLKYLFQTNIFYKEIKSQKDKSDERIEYERNKFK